MCHLEQREGQGYRWLQQLTGRAAGARNSLITMANLTSIAEPVAALLLELPQRDIGGQQPPWDELAAQCDWARSVGAAVHLDGARLWSQRRGMAARRLMLPRSSTPSMSPSTRASGRCQAATRLATGDY